MLINLRNALMAGKRLPTAKDYVQDGLVAMWDGIENAGWGKHDANAIGWKNLATGDVALYSVANETPNWNDDCWRGVSRDDEKFFSAAYPNLATTAGSTVEIVASKSNIYRGVAIGAYGISGGNYCNFEWRSSCFRAYYNINPDQNSGSDTFPTDTRKYFAAIRDASVYSISDGARTLASTTSAGRNLRSSPANIGCDGRTTSMCWSGEICAIRLYSRALAAAEIAANSAIDKERFNLP